MSLQINESHGITIPSCRRAVSQFEQKHVMPTEVGIHFETEKAMFGFPLEFIPCFILDENDKLRHWLPSVVFPCLF